MSSLRIYDILLANNGEEFEFAHTLKDTKLYNPDNLGGGFVYNGSQSLAPTLNNITFDVLFTTDAESTAYDKFYDTIAAMNNYTTVWLRYGIPLSSGYRYAYKPCIIQSITKTEAKYSNAQIVQQITLQAVDSWLELYRFAPNTVLSPSNAMEGPTTKLFSKDANIKTNEYTFPYWYGELPLDNIGDWYNTPDSPFSNGSQGLVMKAPALTISNVESQALVIKGNSFITNSPNSDVIDNIVKNNDVDVDLLKNDRQLNFKSTIANFSEAPISSNGPYGGNYTSFQIKGISSGRGSKLSFTTGSGVVVNEIRFLASGSFTIDTAPWGNIFDVGGLGSSSIDFRKFFYTSADSRSSITSNGASISSIIMRRGTIGV